MKSFKLQCNAHITIYNKLLFFFSVAQVRAGPLGPRLAGQEGFAGADLVRRHREGEEKGAAEKAGGGGRAMISQDFF